MSTRGIIAAMTIEAPTDRDIFLGFLDEVLCPALQAGDVVIMDNLSSHKVDGVRQRIEKRQAELLYLPPYSPDLNPIEKAWSKLKQILRHSKPEPQKPLIRPSPKPFQKSHQPTHRLGSASAFMVYS